MVVKIRGHAVIFICILAAVFLQTNAQIQTCATTSCQNGKCVLINNQPKCECDKGYTKNNLDNTICDDVNECSYANCIPFGWCVNTKGSYYCVCFYGFFPADKDSSYCIRSWYWGYGGMWGWKG